MKGQGFTVDTAGIRGAADGFRRGGDLAGSARDTLSAAAVPTEAFGRSGPGPQLAADLTEIIGGQVSALGTRIERLRALADKLNAAADAYDGSDADSETAVSRAGQGGA